MTQSHTCAYCSQEATFYCGLCKETWYCGREHQVADWKSHKSNCQLEKSTPTGHVRRTVVVLNGREASEEQLDVPADWSGWEQCPAPTLIGVPLMVKAIRPYPGQMPQSQMAVFMMIDPATGFAPPHWQLGPHCNKGMIGFARRDGSPFTTDDFYDLYDYIFSLMDIYPDDPARAERRLTPQDYQRYKLQGVNVNTF